MHPHVLVSRTRTETPTCFVRESFERCAERNARNYFGDGRKVRNEEYYETAGGELLIKIIRFAKVDADDVPVLQKYFMSV